MGWLASESLLWMMLAALLGAAVTWFSVVRKVTVEREQVWIDSVTPVAVVELAPVATSGAWGSEAAAADWADADVPTEAYEEPEPEGLFAAADVTSESSATVDNRPYGPGSVLPREDGASPDPEFRIKGNPNSMLFHTSDSPYFNRTIAKTWFDTEDNARSAGFRRWDARSEPAVVVEETSSNEAVLVEQFVEPPSPSSVEGMANPLSDGSSPDPALRIKGNANSLLFHTEASPYFGRVKAGVWFASEDAAREAGFVRWDEGGASAAAVPVVAYPEDGPYGPGSAHPLEDGASPHKAFKIKGKAASKLFHTYESPYYVRTKAEVWFDSEEAARAAGFSAWNG